MRDAALTLFKDVRKLIRQPEHYDVNVPASKWEFLYGQPGWRACPINDPDAKRFSLFGAVWRSLPAQDQAGKTRQLKAFVKIFAAGLEKKGIEFGLMRDRLNWHLNALDCWAHYHRSHAEVIEALNAVIYGLAEQ